MAWLWVLAGCGGEPWDGSIPPCEGEDPGTCEVGALTVGGVERTWLVSRPAGWRCEDGPWPLVFAFHGSGFNGAALRAEVPLEAAFEGTAVFVYPDGLPRADSGGSTGWVQGRDSEDLVFFDALLDALLATGCYAPDAVSVFGHSRGGRFANTVACFRGERLAAVAEASAGRPEDWQCDDRVPFLVAHAVDDHEIGFGAGRAYRRHWSERNGCAAFPWLHRFETGTCTAFDGCGAPVVFCKGEGVGYRNHFPPGFVLDEVHTFFSDAWRP